MKVVILAGGMGTRLSEETDVRPKPMVEIGSKPIIWHIMKIYSHHGFNEFVICCGYKGEIIKRYFANYFLYNSDVTIDMSNNEMEVHRKGVEPWRVTLVDTGLHTLKGGRMLQVREYLGDETFLMTYGDGVSTVDVRALVDFHREQGVLATLTAVNPPGRFGAFQLERDQTTISTFKEKPEGEGAWINGGFFVLEPGVMDYIDGQGTDWEDEPLEQLATDGRLAAFKHDGFWHPMDTLHDKNVLEEMWSSGTAPWKVW